MCTLIERLLWSVNRTKNESISHAGSPETKSFQPEWFWHGLLLLCIPGSVGIVRSRTKATELVIPGSLSDNQDQVCLRDMMILYHAECFCFTSRHLECVLGVIHCCGHLDCIHHKSPNHKIQKRQLHCNKKKSLIPQI
jgi:hypothetical protein